MEQTELEQCSLLYCQSRKNQMAACQNCWKHPVTDCTSSKKTIAHWTQCKRQKYPICLPFNLSEKEDNNKNPDPGSAYQEDESKPDGPGGAMFSPPGTRIPNVSQDEVLFSPPCTKITNISQGELMFSHLGSRIPSISQGDVTKDHNLNGSHIMGPDPTSQSHQRFGNILQADEAGKEHTELQDETGRRKKRLKIEEVATLDADSQSLENKYPSNHCDPDNSPIQINQTGTPSLILRKHPENNFEKRSNSNNEADFERKSALKSLGPLVKSFQFGDGGFNYRHSCAITRNRVFVVSPSQEKLMMFDRTAALMDKPVYLYTFGDFCLGRSQVVHLLSEENTLIVLRHEGERRVIICNSDALYEVTVIEILPHLLPQCDGHQNEEYIHVIVHITLAPNMLAIHVIHGPHMINSTLFFSLDTKMPKEENIVFLAKLDQSMKNDLVTDGFNIYMNSCVFLRFGQTKESTHALDILECFDMNTIRNPRKRKLGNLVDGIWNMDIADYITYGKEDGDLKNRTHRRNPMNLKLEPGNSYNLAFLCSRKNKLTIFNIKSKQVIFSLDVCGINIHLSNWWRGSLFLFKHTNPKGIAVVKKEMDKDSEIKFDNSVEEVVVINGNLEVEVSPLHNSFKKLEDVDYSFRYFADSEDRREYLLQSVYHIDDQGVLGVRQQTLFQNQN